MAVVIELGAGTQDKGLLPGIKGAFALVIAGFVERIPMLAFFGTFQIVIGIGGLFKEAFLVEIVPVLALSHCQGLAQRSGLPPFTDHGKIPVAVDLPFLEVHLLGPDGAGKGKQENRQQKQQARIHNRILLCGQAGPEASGATSRLPFFCCR